jgi:hypothetical protein
MEVRPDKIRISSHHRFSGSAIDKGNVGELQFGNLLGEYVRNHSTSRRGQPLTPASKVDPVRIENEFLTVRQADDGRIETTREQMGSLRAQLSQQR